jgi:hypothetical protein
MEENEYTKKIQPDTERHYVMSSWQINYTYRAPSGELFQTIAKTLGQARERRDQWLAMLVEQRR